MREARSDRDVMLEELACKFGRPGSVSRDTDGRSKVSFEGRKRHTKLFRRNTGRVQKTKVWPHNSLWNRKHEAETYS